MKTLRRAALLGSGFLLAATLAGLAAPPNDSCSSATAITSPSFTTTQSTADAASAGDPAPACVPNFGNGVWFQYTTPASGQLVVDTAGSDFDTGLGIYTGGVQQPDRGGVQRR